MPSVQQAQQRVVDQLPRNSVKPYIDQLDKPILEIVEVVENDKESKKVDLTLKL